MQIVINISEESYKNIKEQVNKRDYPDMQIGKAIADGKPLPKGHGRLVDVDLLRDQVNHDKREAFSKHQVWLLLSIHNKNIPTILDADEAYKNRLHISEEDYKNRVIDVNGEINTDAEKYVQARLELIRRNSIYGLFGKEFHCGFEESGGHAYNCNDCPKASISDSLVILTSDKEKPHILPTTLFCEQCGITESTPSFGQHYCRYCGTKFKNEYEPTPEKGDEE